MVACAGIFTTTPVTVQVNFFGAVVTLQGLRPLLAAGTEPRAVVTSSLASLHPVDAAIVDACLAGDEAAAVTAAEAVADRGEGYLIYPSQGFLDDPVWRQVVDDTVPMPLHGHARAEQVAPLLGWLAGPENTHVTGQVVFIDGGADAVLRGDRTW